MTDGYKRFFLIGIIVSFASLVSYYLYPMHAFGYRYFGNAYAMWSHHEFWYPIWINGTLNVQKGPLFYWVTHLGWWLFGINRLTMPVIILASYLSSGILAAKITHLLTKNDRAAFIAGVLTLLNPTYLNYTHFIRFDYPLTVCVLLSLYALIKIHFQSKKGYWWLFAIANTLGILVKGPAIIIFTITAGVLAPLLQTQLQKHWLRQIGVLFFYLFISVLLLLIWLIPADLKSGNQYLYKFIPQLLQRFNHIHPDPNLPSYVRSHYNWFTNPIGNIFQYLNNVLSAFYLFLPIFALRLVAGFKSLNTNKSIFFAGILVIPILFFGLFVGLVSIRYVIPLIPFLAIYMGCLFASVTPSAILQKKENKLFQKTLWVLMAVFFFCLIVLWMTHLFLALWPILIGIGIMLLFGWRATDFFKRFNATAFAILAFFVVAAFNQILMNSQYPSVSTTIEKIQTLQKHKTPIYIVDNDFTRSGWAEFLAKNLKLPQYSFANFNRLSASTKNNAWVIVRFKKLKSNNRLIYPLQYRRIMDFKNLDTQVLLPYLAYHQIVTNILEHSPGNSRTSFGNK